MYKNKENYAIREIKLNREALNGNKKNKKENINITNNQARNNIKIQQIPRNNENINYKKIKNIEEQKYYDFHAHFKYNELVDALNKLKSNKNISISSANNNNITYINNITKKDSLNYNNPKIIFNNNETINTNKNKINRKAKGHNHKIVSRNIQMNNYIKYIGYLDEDKDKNKGLTSITNNIQHNKTSFLPKNDVVKQKINLHLEELNKLKHQILLNSNEVKRNEKNGNIIRDNKLNLDQKYNNLISISLSNNNEKNVFSDNKNNYNHNYNYNYNIIEQKGIKNQYKNNISHINKKPINNVINKINKDESINNSKIQLKNNCHLNNNVINNDNKYIKNKKIKKNIFNFNCVLGEKRKAHSSSLSKNKNYVNQIHAPSVISNNITKTNNTSNFNNFHVHETNKKQLNNIITSSRVNNIATKSFQTNKINIVNEPKIKIVSFNYADKDKIKNKNNKKYINSFASSLSNTRDVDKTKSKSNSSSINKINNMKIVTNKYEKIDKNKICKYNSRINTVQKDKIHIKNNIKNINENSKKNINKSLNRNNYNNYNKIQSKEINLIKPTNNNTNNSKINVNNFMFNGQLESKVNGNGNVRINNVIYKNSNQNMNNLDKNKRCKININNNVSNSTKNNNVIKNKIMNNQRINLSKNYNKINYCVETNYSNRRNNTNIAYKK